LLITRPCAREIREKYRDVAIDPDRDFDFYTDGPAAIAAGGTAR
jgi:hypothetical protein